MLSLSSNHKINHLQGVWTASLTPLHADLSPDIELLRIHCDRLLVSGCNGVVLLGTTGEANSFNLNERMYVIRSMAQASPNRDKFIIGTGCCATSDTIELSKFALDQGFNQLLMLPPFYYKDIHQEGLQAYFDTVIKKIWTPELKILYYHFPKLTGVTLANETILYLIRKYPETFIGIKDSSGDWNHMKGICQAFPQFHVFAGSEEFLLRILREGGRGCISATTNISHTLVVEVFRRWQYPDGESLQDKITGLRKAFAAFPLVPALKTLMAVIHNDSRWLTLRPPHTGLSRDEKQNLISAMKSMGIG
jgi:4-hydroxy-tetrahydrodipicolinate synthase